jgi:hypothetical protein
MNNISQFPSAVDYPELDIPALNNAVQGAADASIQVKERFITTRYLPTVHNRVSTVSTAMRDAHFKARECAQTLESRLAINTRALRDLQAELIGAPSQDVKDILEDIDDRAARIIRIVSDDQIALKRLLPPLMQAVDRIETSKYLVQLTADQERLPLEIAEIMERKQKLDQQRQVLSDAMALLEAKGFAAVGRETLLNAQELQKFAAAPPELVAVEKGIELVQQLLEKAEGLINYVNMIAARDRLRDEIDRLVAQVQGKNDELRLTHAKNALIVASHEFEDHRVIFVNEFEKLIAARQSFINTYHIVDVTDEQLVSRLGVDALTLAKHGKVLL